MGPEPVLALLTDQASETADGSWDAVQLSARDTGSGFMLAFRGTRRGHAHENPAGEPVARTSSTRCPGSGGARLGEIDGTALMEDGVDVGGWPFTAGHVFVFTPVAR